MLESGVFHVERDPAEEIRIRLAAHGFHPAQFADPLLQLCELLAVWNLQSNLAGHKSISEIVSGVCADAIALARVLPVAAGVADLGSGAGFPGIPLAILRPTATVVLVEARERRHHFQKAAQRQLGLANLLPVLGRAELLPAHPQPIATAQAMAEPAQVVQWLAPWTQPGGLLCVPLSVAAQPKDWALPDGVAPLEVRRYSVLPEGRERLLWIGRKRP